MPNAGSLQLQWCEEKVNIGEGINFEVETNYLIGLVDSPIMSVTMITEH